MSGPSLFVIALVLAAALLHATWNAIVKGSADRLLALAMVNLGHILVGVALVALYAPPAREAWGFIAASTVIHFFYYGFLLMAYRLGDFSQVYPIARGVAPVLVALGAWIVAGEVLPAQAWAAILIISAAIAAQAFGRRRVDLQTGAVVAALLTGLACALRAVRLAISAGCSCWKVSPSWRCSGWDGRVCARCRQRAGPSASREVCCRRWPMDWPSTPRA
jgi:drug/metabolite transporter (DMT)-like permease